MKGPPNPSDPFYQSGSVSPLPPEPPTVSHVLHQEEHQEGVEVAPGGGGTITGVIVQDGVLYNATLNGTIGDAI